MAYSSDTIVFGIEKKYGVQAIESKEKGLWYLQDDDRELIGILTVKNGIPKWEIFTKDQFKALAYLLKDLKVSQLNALVSEALDIYDVVFN